jgi:hypothetical protein
VSSAHEFGSVCRSWITSASLDLITKSSLKLKFLEISSCQISDQKVRSFVTKPLPSLCSLGVVSSHLKILVLRKFVLCSPQDPDQQIQLVALELLGKLFSLHQDDLIKELQSFKPGVLQSLVHFLHFEHEPVSLLTSDPFSHPPPPLISPKHSQEQAIGLLFLRSNPQRV